VVCRYDVGQRKRGGRGTAGVAVPGGAIALSVSEYVFGVRTSKLTRHLGVKSLSTLQRVRKTDQALYKLLEVS
jgi:hypothetical protein